MSNTQLRTVIPCINHRSVINPYQDKTPSN
jgi:hypothetical protein